MSARIARNFGKYLALSCTFRKLLMKKEEYNGIKDEITKLGFGEKVVPSVLSKWLQPEIWELIAILQVFCSVN